MIEIVLVIFGLLSILTNVACYKIISNSLSKIDMYENLYREMNDELNEFTLSCERALNTPIYSNEPVIMSFVDSMRNIYTFLSNIDENYELDIQLTDENVDVERSNEFRDQFRTTFER